MIFSIITTYARGTALLLTVALLCMTPVTHEGTLQRADAILSAVGGGVGGMVVSDIGNTIQNTIQTISAAALEQKELVLDGMFHNIAQKALQKMTGDIVTWLNSGLDGSPAFVTDILAALQKISDTTAADFIYGDELSTACPSFQPDVRAALAKQYTKENYGGFKEKAACTINENGNAAAFLAGDFFAGGYASLFELILHPENTSIGYTLAAKVQLNELVTAKQEAEKMEWNWGDGVYSKKTCTTVGTGANARQNCTMTTPASIMQDLASKALGMGMDSLLNADEMNETIGALFGNIATQAVTGINGLLGLGGNASFSNNTFGASASLSYLDALKEESAASGIRAVRGGKIKQALATETKVLELQLAIVDNISKVTSQFATTSVPYVGNSCWDLKIPTALSDTLGQVSTRLPTTIATVMVLQDLATKYASTTSSSEQLQLLEQLASLETEGLLSGQAAVVELDYFLTSELKVFIADFKKQLAAEATACG